MVVKDAVMRYHGGKIVPETPAVGEKAENGLIEEAGNGEGIHVCIHITN